MAEPVIHSESWTGPPQSEPAYFGLWRQPNWSRVARPAEPRNELSSAQRGWSALLALVILSPLLLIGAWMMVLGALPDALWAEPSHWLAAAGLVALGVGAREAAAGRPERPALRSAMLSVILLANVGLAAAYPYLAFKAHGAAVAEAPERTFEILIRRDRQSDYFLHQRADGSTVEGHWAGPAIPYGETCAIAQRLNGDFGFAWVRVVDRTARPTHELHWPIRREDCFSAKPLSTLHG